MNQRELLDNHKRILSMEKLLEWNLKDLQNKFGEKLLIGSYISEQIELKIWQAKEDLLQFRIGVLCQTRHYECVNNHVILDRFIDY